MMRPTFRTIVLVIPLANCAAGAPAAPSRSYIPAHREAERPKLRSRALEAAEGAPASLRSRGRPSRLQVAGVLAHARKANDSPIREPDAGIAVGAEQVYAWSEGALYPLHAAPEHVTDIALQPGETLVSVAAGDTVRWIVGDTTSGTGETRRSHILVKPIAAGLKTNLVIATDRRVYHIEAESRQSSATTGISWTYADDGLLALGGGLTEGSAQSVTGGVAVDSLNFAYRIEGDSPAWRPLRAFDDGHQVFIEFPSTLGDGEAPPLFVRGEGGEAQLVNYRVRGRYYVVDHLFGSAELRMGERHQQVVRIVRDAKGVHHRRNAS